MSSESSASTPKQKKRVPQLVAFYEEIGTPKSRKKRNTPDTPVNEVELSPAKKSKLEEPKVVEELEQMEVEEEVVAVEEIIEVMEAEVEEVPKAKESKKDRKSRRADDLNLNKYSKRIYSAAEILSTERTYVEALQQLHKVRNKLYGRCPKALPFQVLPAFKPQTLYPSADTLQFITMTAILTISSASLLNPALHNAVIHYSCRFPLASSFSRFCRPG